MSNELLFWAVGVGGRNLLVLHALPSSWQSQLKAERLSMSAGTSAANILTNSDAASLPGPKRKRSGAGVSLL